MQTLYVIPHPGSGEPIYHTDFDHLMHKYFEGHNIPRLCNVEVAEPFKKSHKRVSEWLSQTSKKE